MYATGRPRSHTNTGHVVETYVTAVPYESALEDATGLPCESELGDLEYVGSLDMPAVFRMPLWGADGHAFHVGGARAPVSSNAMVLQSSSVAPVP